MADKKTYERRAVIKTISGSRDCCYCIDGGCYNPNSDEVKSCSEETLSFPEKCPLPVIETYER